MEILRKILLTTALMLLSTLSSGTLWGDGDGRCAVSAQTKTPPEGTTAYYELTIRDRFKHNDWAGGKKLLDEAIKKYPQMSAINELMGQYYIHQAEKANAKPKEATAFYDKARYYLIRAITIDEKNVQARYHMLKVETETKQYSSAIVYCNDLLEENPYNEDLWRKKIDLYRKLGNNAEADRLLERLVAIYPGDDLLRRDLVERKTVQAKHQRDNGDAQGQEQSLRALVEYDAKNPDHHRALTNLLYRTGRIDEAAEAAAQGFAATQRMEFVQKRTSMLCEMNRHREAVEYVRGLMRSHSGLPLAALLRQLETDAAYAAQYNDAYTAFAKIYDKDRSLEALDYLVNTSIERWYLDDALMYVEESIKRRGETPKMLYNQYLVNKRLGNTRKANALLEKLYKRYPDNEDIAEEMMLLQLDSANDLIAQGLYSDATPLLEQVYASNAYPYLREAALTRLYNCYFQTKQYAKAETLLESMTGIKRITQTAMLYNAWGRPARALDYLADAYHRCAETDQEARGLIANTYQEIAVPYVKSLLANNRVAEAGKLLAEAVELCPDDIDILRYGITAASRMGDTATAARYVTRGREAYPRDPYFVLKGAQLRHLGGDHRATLAEIKPLLGEYVGDSLVIGLYVESSIDIAKQCLIENNPDEALAVIQAALDIAPEAWELYLYQSLAYEKKKDWRQAIEAYEKYKPGFAELGEYRHHLEELSHRILSNSLSFEYQQARPGNEDIISGNAYLNYSHTINSRNIYNIGMSYAGRDGVTSQNDTEMTRGGTGVGLSLGYEHRFSTRFSGRIEAAAATRYFPILMARLTATYDFKHAWTASPFVCYRLLRSYSGIYGWQSNIVGYDSATNQPIYGDPEYVRTGWQEAKRSMLQAGVSVSKDLSQFTLTGEASGLLFAKQLYFNTNLKMRYTPVDGNSSHLFVVGGVGTAPESSLIDRSLPVGFDKLNTFVGAGGSYFANRWLTFTLSGTWYTMLSQSERLSTTYTVNDPYIREDYRNYFYLHAAAIISF